jgi:hypothetical protein
MKSESFDGFLTARRLKTLGKQRLLAGHNRAVCRVDPSFKLSELLSGCKPSRLRRFTEHKVEESGEPTGHFGQQRAIPEFDV